MSGPEAHRLTDEHAVLRQEIRTREQRVLGALDGGGWPVEEVRGLVDYLRYEVLDQAVNEERLLYPMTPEGFADQRIQQLVDDHVQLRDVADELAGMAATGPRDGPRLTAALRALREGLDRHLRNEQDVLLPVSDAGVESLRQPFRSHEWFSLTEGPDLDMDRLPRAFAHSAVMERLTRLRPAERLEISSGRPLQTLQELLTRRGMSATFGWAYLEEGPQRWRAQVTRRPGPH